MEKIIDFILSVKFYGPIIYIVVAYIIYLVISTINNKIIVKTKQNKKRDTVLRLFNSVIKYILIVIVILLTLDLYGYNTNKLLASLGIAGLVVGLALQDTIKNMLAGILIIMDDRYNVGDIIKVNDFTGEVVMLGLQSTKVKDISGNVFTINNSNISNVINFSNHDSTLFIDIPVSYSTDIEKLEKVLRSLEEKVLKIENVVGEYNLLGVDSFNNSDITYKISIKTKPFKYFNVKREINKMIKVAFDKEGIEIPFNQVDVHMK